MNTMIDTIDFTIDCPQCGKQIKEKLGRLHRNRYCTCPKCGRIDIKGDGLAKIGRAIKDLESKLSGFSKTMKIKL